MVMRSLGQNPTEAELKDMIDAIDLETPGQCSLPEFLTMFECTLQKDDGEAEIQKVFSELDKDGTGFVSAAEIHRVMTNLGEKLAGMGGSDEALTPLAGSDRLISYEEFRAMMTGKSQ